MALDPQMELERQIRRGFLRTHAGLGAGLGQVLLLASTTTALVELLAERGLLDPKELDARTGRVGEQLAQTGMGRGLEPDLHPPPEPSSAAAVDIPVDCENRRHLCGSVCCALDVVLGPGDVDAARLRWDLGRPYHLRRLGDGRCHHLSRTTGACAVYEGRPSACRAYTCAADPRIWKDFRGYVPNTARIEALLAQRSMPRLLAAERGDVLSQSTDTARARTGDAR